MNSKIIALERALLTLQQEIAKYKASADVITVDNGVSEKKPEQKKTLGLKRAKTTFVSVVSKKRLPEPEEDEDTLPLSEGEN